MEFDKFSAILNKHLFEKEKTELLIKIAERPERYIGLFRPTKPSTKILQNLFQSHEIKFGNAFEEIIEKFLEEFGFKILDKNIKDEQNKILNLDQFFEDQKNIFFIEQKIRDDHDSSKKRGQILNFEKKLEIVYKKYGTRVIAIMYFLDPDLEKNKNYYQKELEKLSAFYQIQIKLFYGSELFYFLNHPNSWNEIIEYLKRWKEKLSDYPEIDFDKNPKESFDEIKELQLRHWRKLIENEKLWEEGIFKAIFKRGETLRLLIKFYENLEQEPYKIVAKELKNKLEKYY